MSGRVKALYLCVPNRRACVTFSADDNTECPPMTHLIAELRTQFPDLVLEVSNEEQTFSRIDDCNDFGPESLIFVSDQTKLVLLEHASPAVVVTTSALAAQIQNSAICRVTVKDARLAQALIKQHYFDYDASDPEWPEIHPSAVVRQGGRRRRDPRVGHR